MSDEQLRVDLLVLLEDGAHTVTELVEWTGCNRTRVRAALSSLASKGQTRRVGNEKKWALASHEPRVGRPPALERRGIDPPLELVPPLPRRRPGVQVERHAKADAPPELEELDALDLTVADADDEDLEALEDVARLRRGKSPLRQPPDRPETQKVTPAADSGSWWITGSREEFSKRARAEANRLVRSKGASLVPPRTLQ